MKFKLSESTAEALEALWELKKLESYTVESLKVCKKAIEANPSEYTAWQIYLKHCRSIGDDEQEEFVGRLIDQMPKNYQIWNFRRQIYFCGMSSCDKELGYAAQALSCDGKNYHAWAHRQAVLNREENENLWNGEMEYVDRVIDEDPFNNSAWTQRALVVRHTSTTAEFDRVTSILVSSPHSISGWEYFRYLIWEFHPELICQALQFCLSILDNHPACRPCLNVLYQFYASLTKSDPSKSEEYMSSAERIRRDLSRLI